MWVLVVETVLLCVRLRMIVHLGPKFSTCGGFAIYWSVRLHWKWWACCNHTHMYIVFMMLMLYAVLRYRLSVHLNACVMDRPCPNDCSHQHKKVNSIDYTSDNNYPPPPNRGPLWRGLSTFSSLSWPCFTWPISGLCSELNHTASQSYRQRWAHTILD